VVAVNVISTHNFLYSDRHKTLYPNITVYLEGDKDKIGPFIELLEEGRSPLEICKALELQYRGDVLFAIMIVHFYVRDGLADRPLVAPDIPPELLSEFPRYEAEWQAHKARVAGEH
jgi:hypothetical protein